MFQYSPVDRALGVRAAGAGEAGIRGRGPGLYPRAASDGVRLRLVTRQTGAYWVTLSVGATLCVRSTGAGVTRIRLRGAPRTVNTLHGVSRVTSLSPVVVTNVASPTVPVHLTLPLTPGDGVWHGNEAGEAAAHGVTL